MSRICKTHSTRVHQIQKAEACRRVKIYADLTSSEHREHTSIMFHRIACRQDSACVDLWLPTQFFSGDTQAVIVTILRDIIVTSVIIRHKWRLIESKVDLSTLVLFCPHRLMTELRSVRVRDTMECALLRASTRIGLLSTYEMFLDKYSSSKRQTTSISATFESAARWMRYAMNFTRRSLLSCVHNYLRKKSRCSSPSMNPTPTSPQLMTPLSNTKWATNVGVIGTQTMIFFFKL